MNPYSKAKKIENPHPAISIFNFHYAHPPDAVRQNYGLNRIIGDNETGFKGTADDHYRMEAWEFILAGGGLYNNLDYSFTAGHEDGTFVYPPKQPGGGNPGFRKQMKVLVDFIYGFDFIRMKPLPTALTGPLTKGARSQVLAEPGRQYALYFKGAPRFAWELDLPQGKYRVEWLDAVTGRQVSGRDFDHAGGPAPFENPPAPLEVAVRVVRSAQ